MDNKRFYSIICSLIVVYGCILLGCPKEAGDTWTPVSSLDEIKGTWKGSSSITIPEIPLSELLSVLPEDGLAMLLLFLKNTNPPQLPKSRLDYDVETIIDDQEAVFDITINCKKYLDDAMQDAVVPSVWAMIEASYDSYMPDDVIPDEVGSVEIEILTDYKVRMTGSSPLLAEEDFDLSVLEDSGFSLEINEKGDKLKLSVDNAALGADGLEIKDIILQKQ